MQSGSSTIIIYEYVYSVYTYTAGVHLFFNGSFYQSWKSGIDKVDIYTILKVRIKIVQQTI